MHLINFFLVADMKIGILVLTSSITLIKFLHVNFYDIAHIFVLNPKD